MDRLQGGCFDLGSRTAPIADGSRTASEIRLILERRHEERVTLRDLGAALGLSPFQILRVFQRHCGLTPHEYLVQFRVRKASTLLLEGEPIAQVAAQVGFVDQSHMTKHFKRLLGMTPCRYRMAGASDSRPEPA